MPYTCGQDSTEPGESEQEHTEKRESTATDELPQKKKKNTREARGRKIQTRQTVEWRFGTLPHRNHKKIKKKKS